MHKFKKNIVKLEIKSEKYRKQELALEMAADKRSASLMLKARTSVMCAHLLVEEISFLANSEELLDTVLPFLAKARTEGLERAGEMAEPLLRQAC